MTELDEAIIEHGATVTEMLNHVGLRDEVGWLRAAQTGGLPAPGRPRWQPLRVGIANLWEYDDAEFWFADGRLVLRGGNGAGKTKVLELTTLMLLRGEIAPSVLDPFGSQHRTMRFNLLPTGDGDDPRPPVDVGLGYAWVEFGRRDDDGTEHFFTCGLGASARAGTGSTPVSTWHFVTRLRLGPDFRLISEGRAVEQKDLKKLDGITMPPSAVAYRARLADELFGLSPESYDNLTELLKQLRKPKLGERLNPASLANTLRDALPPLATHEVDQLADGWEHLEQLRSAMQRTEDAARAIATFVRVGWRPWARVVLRRRADEMASATTQLDKTTADKKAAEGQVEQTRAELESTRTILAQTKSEHVDADATLRELLESQAYQDAVAAAGRVESLRRETVALRSQRQGVVTREQREQDAERKAGQRAEVARAETVRAGADVEDAAQRLTTVATDAGLARALTRHLPERDVDALHGEHQSRTVRFGHLTALDGERGEAQRTADRSEQAVELASKAVSDATGDEDRARHEVQRAAATLTEQVRAWAAEASEAVCTAELTGRWCDLIAEMTVIDDDGTPPRPPSVVEAMRAHVAAFRSARTERVEALRLARVPVAVERDAVADRLETARRSTESEPAEPVSWQRRIRPALPAEQGAPLWRLVNPVRGLDDSTLAALETALAGSGLLDAWVAPDGSVDFASMDVHVSVGYAPVESNLLAVLEPATAGGVPLDVITRILAGFGWYERANEHADGDWCAADGSWRLGGLAGRGASRGPAAYLGAAARAAARARLIARLETDLAALEQRIGEFDEQLAAADTALRRLDIEARTIPVPGEREVTVAVVRWAERHRSRLALAAALAGKEDVHHGDLARLDQKRAVFAEYAGTHGFRLTDLDGQRRALAEFGDHLTDYRYALEKLQVREDALAGALAVHQERVEALRAVQAESEGVAVRLRQAEVKLGTAEQALGAGARQQLDRKHDLEQLCARLTATIDSHSDRLITAQSAQLHAENVLANHEQRRAEAELRRDAAMTALWEAVDAGLARTLDLELPQRHAVQPARELATAIRREVEVKAEESDQSRAWGACVQKLEELRQALLPSQDARVLDEDDTLPRVEIHSDAAHGFELPPDAADTLADLVRGQRESYDAEQQRVLATLLGSTFIEHLKDRLDYTTRTFANINAHLVSHPTRQGHAVKVVCEADPSDPDAEAVVGALGQGYAELSPERQELVREFLSRRIEQARSDAAAEGVADWKQQLTRALDYRGWLRITLQYRPGSTSKWSLFDAAKHGAKSGGEKVVLLSQPLFAAAVVAYDAAVAHAPRWVWLDEAMTGVDTQIKASFMGLTVDFELDIMLTAHDEWCNYDTVPAVAVYDLARERHLPGVDVLPYLWCGGTLTTVEVDRLGFTAAAEPPTEGLFGIDDE
ncbi:TIGR02680 family protein [Nocardia sp. alder85J]|uniref:TIGR02680 family protein n=1 Tax=Nocardia sp. alder85J TaxID=2862949 RepID=UPI001CD67988|nr:TIGR02680 family protein [Nocardia sp. alder85J]MCX4095315.1 TIGR02680 family protein [Nocardia sp. alder85J]